MPYAKFRLAFFILFLLTAPLSATSSAQEPFEPSIDNGPTGLTINTDQAAEGYVLVPMLQSRYTLLLSNDGRVVHYWESEYPPALSAYLTSDGTLIRTNSLPAQPFGPTNVASFMGGRVEALSWDGSNIWTINYIGDDYVGHHDIEPLPNGNILVLAYDRHSREEAIAVGRKPELLTDDGDIWSEAVLEINPQTNEIVWEWRVWDHLIQDFDPSLANYGVVADHPERIDINYSDRDLTDDWLHMNAVDYNAALDQIVLSSKHFSEIWIIDHSTDTQAALGDAGNLLYRWGNPETYQAGTDADQILFGQHDAQWIPDGYPGAGNIILFDNGSPERPYSRVVELAPPVDEAGSYRMAPGEPTAPATPVWQYVADPPEDLYAQVISGAQRQPNGNTLIMSGTDGRIFEVTPTGEIVWEYYLPLDARAFRAERYDLPALAEFDQGQDYSEALGFNTIWGRDCADGSQPRLHAYLYNEADTMTLFIQTYGEQEAQASWETEACSDHDGIAD